MTEWKSIIGYENEYLVSNNCDVFSLRSKKRLKPSINEKGYMRVCLQKRGMKSWKRVNRLVAEAFIPNPEDKPTVNHKNGIRDDNHVWNLEWATVLEQNSDPMRMKNMSKSMMRSEYVLRKKRKVIQINCSSVYPNSRLIQNLIEKPPKTSLNVLIVVISSYEDNISVKPFPNFNNLLRTSETEIPKMKHCIIHSHPIIPVLYESLIVFCNIFKRSVGEF